MTVDLIRVVSLRMDWTLRGVFCVAALMIGAETAAAQQREWRLFGRRTGDLFGWTIRNAGDVDGDGYDDVIASAQGNVEGGDGAGMVGVISGRTGLVIRNHWTAHTQRSVHVAAPR